MNKSPRWKGFCCTLWGVLCLCFISLFCFGKSSHFTYVVWWFVLTISVKECKMNRIYEASRKGFQKANHLEWSNMWPGNNITDHHYRHHNAHMVQSCLICSVLFQIPAHILPHLILVASTLGVTKWSSYENIIFKKYAKFMLSIWAVNIYSTKRSWWC